ncbi:MAG: hypothetical protein K2X03_17715 [Bryobacteraceae bacterium]|nr:hypothetical protein [Bryobacteraceae bacterium]
MKHGWLILWASLLCAQVETGTHWPGVSDFPRLKSLGYSFVVTTVDGNPNNWATTFDAADRAGLKLIIGIYNPPYTLSNGIWTITPTGQSFIRYAQSRSALVKALFVFNEPYWVDPWTYRTSLCGQVSAADLRTLRTEIRKLWPEAKIFHDIGAPQSWAPGGEVNRENACIGNKYADQTGVADFVGVWYYPFETNGYLKTQALAAMRASLEFTKTRMGAETVFDAQAFRCRNCGGEASRFPTAAEIKDWNCALRELQPHAISWYVWRQNLYDDYLANYPALWPNTSPSACGGTAAAPVPDLSSVASAATFQSALPMAPGSIVSIFGERFASEVQVAGTNRLPKELSSTAVLLNGDTLPLYFVAPTQINALLPYDVPAGNAALQIRRGTEVSGKLTLRVADQAPGIFTLNEGGTGAAVAVDALTNQVVTESNPIAAGSFAVIYATGLGRLRAALATGEIPMAANEAAVRPVVTLNGNPVTVLYAGVTPGYLGLYQVNIQVPSSLAPGTYPLRITQSGVASNLATLTVR